MNNSELDSILKKARAPQPPKEFWEEFPQQVARQLNRARTEHLPTKANWFPRMAWSFAVAICVLIAFAVGHWRGRTEMATASSRDILANAKVVHETLAMFPNEVRAIVEDEHGLNLILSENKNVPVSTPLYVHVCDGKQCVSVVTFSGQEIQIAGQKMTVLADARGGIILTGNQFVWSNTKMACAGSHLKIEAKNLGTAAM
jgi:hypothetical protein